MATFPPGQYSWVVTAGNGKNSTTSSAQYFEYCDPTLVVDDFASSFYPANGSVITDGSLSTFSWVFDSPQFEVLFSLKP